MLNLNITVFQISFNKFVWTLDNTMTRNRKNNQNSDQKLSQADQETIKSVVKSVLVDSDILQESIVKEKILQNTPLLHRMTMV